MMISEIGTRRRVLLDHLLYMLSDVFDLSEREYARMIGVHYTNWMIRFTNER